MSSEFPENVCLLVKITCQTSFEYKVPFQMFLQQNFSNFFVFDFDNFSESMVIDYAIQLLNNAQKAVIILQAEPDSPLGSVLKLIPVMHRQKHKLKAVLNGEHAQLAKVFKPLGEKAVFNVNETTLADVMNA